MTNSATPNNIALRELNEILEIIKGQVPVKELGDFPKLDAAMESQGVRLPITKIQQLYSDAELNAKLHVNEGAPAEYVTFAKAFPTSIVAREIDCRVTELQRKDWRKYLELYWDKVAEAGYSLLHDQIDSLVAGLVKVAISANSKSSTKSVIIPILPIGNCLAVSVLEQLYIKQGWQVTTPLWNLPRNPKLRNVAINKLLTTSVGNSDVVVHYVDEWITGNNFLGIVEGVIKAKWPLAQLNVTAICGEENSGLKNTAELMAALDPIGCRNPFGAAMIKIPKSKFPRIDKDGERLFSQDFGRLVAWRKLSSAMRLLTAFVKTAKTILFTPGVAEREVATMYSLTSLTQALVDQLGREREMLKFHEPEFWQQIEESYLAEFPDAPYIFDMAGCEMTERITIRETLFVTTALSNKIPLTIKIVQRKMPKAPDLSRNVYVLPAMRTNSRIPYHLLKLGPPESGPANAFGNLVAKLATELLTKLKD